MSQKVGELQLNQMKKTTLSIAIREAIKELGIQREQQSIFKLLKQSFNSKFPAFKIQNSSLAVLLKGSIFNSYEYPIGDDDRQQYYTGLLYQASLSGSKFIETVCQNEKKPLVFLQAYSKNEDPKKRTFSKAGKEKKEKKNAGDLIKKKVKKS